VWISRAALLTTVWYMLTSHRLSSSGTVPPPRRRSGLSHALERDSAFSCPGAQACRAGWRSFCELLPGPLTHTQTQCCWRLPAVSRAPCGRKANFHEMSSMRRALPKPCSEVNSNIPHAHCPAVLCVTYIYNRQQ